MRKGQTTWGLVFIPLIFVVTFSILMLFSLTFNLSFLNGAQMGSIILAMMILSSTPFSWAAFSKAGVKPKKNSMYYYFFGSLIVFLFIFFLPEASSFAAFIFVVISPYFWQFKVVYSINQFKSPKIIFVLGLLVVSGTSLVISNLWTSSFLVMINYPLMTYTIKELARTSPEQSEKVGETKVTGPLRFFIRTAPYEYFIIGSYFVLFGLFNFFANVSLTGQSLSISNFGIVVLFFSIGAAFIYYGELVQAGSRKLRA